MSNGLIDNRLYYDGFIIDDVDLTVQAIVSKLKFLSKIKKGEKLDTATLSLVENRWFSNAYRYIFATESRERTLNFIRTICNDALKIASECMNSQQELHRCVAKMIIENLKEAKKGIQNLLETYKDDRFFTSRVETFLSIFETKVGHLESKGIKS